MSQSPVLLSDETGFDCLELQGRGVTHKAKAVAEDAGLEDTSQKNFILPLSMPRGVPHPITWFAPPFSRSAESIGKTLGDSFRPEVLVTDGYPGYNTLIREHMAEQPPGHQCCLIHWRRKVVDAVGIEQLSKEFSKPSDPQLAE